MEEGLGSFMWHKCTSQTEGEILSSNCKTRDVITDKLFDDLEPTWKQKMCSGDYDVALDVW